MARPRKPTALLDLSGAYAHDPKRRRLNEPVDSRPLGAPPARLPKTARPFWAELAEMSAPGVLKRSDRWAVELASRMMAKAGRGRASSVELNILRSLLGACGLTPADRTKISTPAAKPQNAYSQLAEEAKEIHGRPN